MRNQFVKMTVAGLIGALTIGSFGTCAVEAAPTAGLASYTSSIVVSDTYPTAGVTSMFAQCMTDTIEQKVVASAQPAVKENETNVVASEYADMAVAQVKSCLNIRAEANEEAEVLGKLYNGCVATVLETEGEWYKITSGSVTGYVMGKYVVVGDEALLKSVGRRVALVQTETLRVRAEASTESDILGLVPEGEDLTVIDETTEGWVCVSIEEGDGYVSADYVSLSTEYTYAESKEEEAARLEAEAAAAEAAAAAAQAAQSSSKKSSSKSSGKKYKAPDGVSGKSVAKYASQFVGNPYRYGGSSLTNGTDCSGFVMAVYKEFGVSLPHSSRSMRSVGASVSVSDIKAGDIVCYSGHVGIYVGNNTIVHASNKKDGIKFTSPVNYKKILAVRRIF